MKLEIFGVEKSPVGVKVFASPDGREETVITYNPQKKELVIDFAKSSVKGPVVIAFEDAAEAIRIANATAYGLVAYVWTADLSTGMRMGEGHSLFGVHQFGRPGG